MVLIPFHFLFAEVLFTGIVITQHGSLNIRSGPGEDYPIIGKAEKGELLSIINMTWHRNSFLWYQVEMNNGTLGYASGKYIFLLENSSLRKYFGVGAWLDGRDCPAITLFWKDLSSRYVCAYFKNKDENIFELGEGMAIFSPDCNYFWFVNYYGYNNPDILVYSTLHGELIAKFSGFYPAWSEDSRKIYLCRKQDKYQLWAWSLEEDKYELIYEVDDHEFCQPPGEGIDWWPVRFSEQGNVIWTYPTDIPSNQNDTIDNYRTRILTIDPETKEVIKTDWGEKWCN